MTDRPHITIDAPDGPTILAARHLDATEGRVQVGTTVDTATRAAITRVLAYVARAHNTPRPAEDDGAHAAQVPAATEATELTSTMETCACCGGGPMLPQTGNRTSDGRALCIPCAKGTCGCARTTRQRWADAILHRGPGYDLPVPRFTAHPVTPDMEATATARAIQAAADNEKVTAFTAATSAPAEHCGHHAPQTLFTTRPTECVLRPGHSGSHADDRGCRWGPVPATADDEPTPAGLREQYASAVECAIGLNVDCGGTEGVHRVRDAVLAVRDRHLEQLRQRLALADTELQQRAATESADAAAGSYALRAEEAEAKVREYEHMLNWHTTCPNCARTLDSCYAETMRAETAEQQRDQYASLVRDFLDPDPCQFDHHGYCQAHAAGLGGEPMSCPHRRARKVLADLDSADLNPQEQPGPA